MDNSVPAVRLLLLSREPEVLRVIRTAAKFNSWQLIEAPSAWGAMEKLLSDLEVDVLLMDLPSGNSDGYRWLRSLRQLRSRLPVLLIDHCGQAGTHVDSIRVGSTDYLVAPVAVTGLYDAIVHTVSSARNGTVVDIAIKGIEQPRDGLLFIGASPKMHRLTAQAALLAESDLPVFISGEPGSGKRLIARLLHHLSARSSSVFVEVDCASFSDELLEREIFGYDPPHEEGAEGTRCGKLESSAGGTLFLDEIEELPLQLQMRLAHMIESRRLIRVGDSQPSNIDVRVVAASSVPIDRASSDGRIVPELLRQFGSREVRVPPLRERKEELPLLARHYMYELSRQFGVAPKDFPIATEEAWQSHHWPGNLRELRQFVKRFLILGGTAWEAKKIPLDQAHEVFQTVLPEMPDANPLDTLARRPLPGSKDYKSLRSIIRSVREEAERTAIASALEETSWNRKAAARLLKVSYRSILYKIEQYQMDAPTARTTTAPERFSLENSRPEAASAKPHWA